MLYRRNLSDMTGFRLTSYVSAGFGPKRAELEEIDYKMSSKEYSYKTKPSS